MAIAVCFHYFFLARVLSLDEKDQNPKAQPSTFKIVALRIFLKEEVICRINPANSYLFAGLIRQIVPYLPGKFRQIQSKIPLYCVEC